MKLLRRMIAALFNAAKQTQPALVFFDEADYVMKQLPSDSTEAREGIRCKMLAAMTEVVDSNIKVAIFATTNRPHLLDQAYHRRFPQQIYVRLPDGPAIMQILKAQLANRRFGADITDASLSALANSLASRRLLSAAAITRAIKVEMKRQLLWELDKATHFKQVCRSTSIVKIPIVYLYRDQEVIDGSMKIRACSPSESGAFAARVKELSGPQLDRLCTRPITMQDITAALNETAASTTHEQLRQLEDYDQKWGTRLSKRA